MHAYCTIITPLSITNSINTDQLFSKWPPNTANAITTEVYSSVTVRLPPHQLIKLANNRL